MKIVKVTRQNATAAGILYGDSVKIIGSWSSSDPGETPFTLPSLSLAELSARCDASPESVPLGEVQIAVPADPGRKIICVGMNYRDHTTEIKYDVTENPVLFTRSLDSLVADGQPIIRPKVSETFDFEGEIAVIIGKPGRHISRDNALDHVFGYSCFLDGSVRAYQKHSLTAGKNFLRSGAMGPYIVTRDEVGSLDFLLETRLNGEVVQSAHASDMIFGIAEVISYCSRWTELRAGDVIATGTPGGVGSRREPPLWMKAGDQIEVTVSGVGKLSNPVVDEE